MRERERKGKRSRRLRVEAAGVSEGLSWRRRGEGSWSRAFGGLEGELAGVKGSEMRGDGEEEAQQAAEKLKNRCQQGAELRRRGRRRQLEQSV